MLTVILIMSSGMAVGLLIRQFVHFQERFFKVVDSLIPFAVWLLLFLLGVAVGSNEIIVRNLGSLGLVALSVAVAATLLSVLLSAIVVRLFFKHES